MKTKNIFKQILTFLIFLVSSAIFSQALEIKITDMQYDLIPINDCGTIDLKSQNTHTFSFILKMQKMYDSNNTNGINGLANNGTLKISLGSDGTLVFSDSYSITSSDWVLNTNENLYKISLPLSFTLQNSDIEVDGNTLGAVYESNFLYPTPCDYNITKPHFSLNQGNITLACENTNPITFIVTNTHNSPGNLSHQWNVGNGWSRNGFPVSGIFTTASNTITLTPNTYPLSNVSVIPILDGVNYPTLTSTISLSAYNPSNSIVGSNGACSFESYSIDNLPTNTSVAWSISNTSIASLTSSSGNQTNINVSGRGVLTLTATLTNSCGQVSPPITKDLTIGYPAQAVSISGPTVVGKGVLASYSTPTIEGATEYEWRLPPPYQTVTTFNYFGNNWELLLATSTTSIISTFVGYSNAGGLVQVWGKNNCGNGGATSLYVEKAETNEDIKPGGGQYPRAQNSGLVINDNISFFPNPVKDNLQINIKVLKEKTKYSIQLFDLNSRLIKEMVLKNKQTKINLKGIANGTYIVKLISNDSVKNQTIIINH